MAAPPQGAPRQGEGAHPRPRLPRSRAARAPHGRDREGVRLPGPRRRGHAARPLRRSPPAHRRALHVPAGLGGRLSQLQRRRGRARARADRAPGHAGHIARVRLPRADREARALPQEEGLAPHALVLLARQRLQLRLQGHGRRVGRAAGVQLQVEGRARGGRHGLLLPGRGAHRAAGRELLPARGRPRLPHLLDLRPRRRDAGRVVLLARPDRARAPGGVGGAEGPRRRSPLRQAGLSELSRADSPHILARMGKPGLYGGMPAAAGPPGMAPRLLEFADELRKEGVAVGTSELLDAFHALRAVEREAVLQELQEERFQGAEVLDLEALRERIREAIRAGSDGEMRDLARLAIAAFGRQGEGSGVIGVDVQRIRRTLGLKAEKTGGELPDPAAVPRDELQEFEQHVRRELERQMIERTQALPPAKPLREFDRALPSNPAQDLSQVHRVVAQLKRRLASHGREHRGRRRSWHVDVRRTMRASLQTGGVPLELKYRPRRPRRPELYVLCDVSTSVTSASVFFLSVLHALHDQFRKQRSFVFVERISEVTDVFARERSFEAVSRAIATDAGVADVSGYTDYGRVLLGFIDKVVDHLHPPPTVIVLGDARTNGREPHAGVFAHVAERAGRTFWMNPEPKLYWNYGDSVMAAYEPHCTAVFECWTTKQLEGFVNAIADLRHVRA